MQLRIKNRLKALDWRPEEEKGGRKPEVRFSFFSLRFPVFPFPVSGFLQPKAYSL